MVDELDGSVLLLNGDFLPVSIYWTISLNTDARIWQQELEDKHKFVEMCFEVFIYIHISSSMEIENSFWLFSTCIIGNP